MSSTLADFWRNYVYIGVLTYSMGAVAVLIYSFTTPGPHRQLMVALGSISLLASVGPFRVVGLRLVSTRWSKTFFTSWAASTFLFIALGAILDGGVRSPLSYFLVLPMLFAGLAYSAGTVSLLAGVGVLTTVAVGLLTPHQSWSDTAFLAVAMVIAGAITAVAALNRDHLMSQLMDAASLDALTGCLSRGAFQERLDHECKLARRHRTSLSLIVADMDNLKTLNDSGGHRSGDRALRSLAAVLSQEARGTDVVGRLGGDEFAMLLHATDQDSALAVATRLKDALHASTDSESVTASLGVSAWLGPDDRADELLRRADEALYTAKRAGRDRLAVWEPPVSDSHAGSSRLGRRPRRIVSSTGRV